MALPNSSSQLRDTQAHSQRTDTDTLPNVFDVMPMALWLEDYSQLKTLFDQWRAAGVTDLKAYLQEDPLRVSECSRRMRILKVNQAALTLYSAKSFDELQSRLKDVFSGDMQATYINELVQLWNGDTAFKSQTVNYALDGRRLDILLNATILPGYESDWGRVLVAIDDISALEDTRRKLCDSESYTRSILEHAPVSLWIEDFSTIKELLEEVREQGITDFRTFTDVHPEFVDRCMSEIHVLDVNQYTVNLFAAPDKATLLRRLPDVFRDEMRGNFREQLIDLWEGRLLQQREVVNYALDGKQLYIHLQLSVFEGREHDWGLVLLALTDITARKKAEAYLEYLGKHDVLTQLKNRSFFVDEMSRLERKGQYPVTVIVIDMNNLKEANDQMGHAAGDALLRRAGEVLGKAIEGVAQASRVGGDEFVILLPRTEAAAGEVVMENIRKLTQLNNQFYSGPTLGFSLGMATCDGSTTLTETLRQADLAMYEHKRSQHELRDSLDAETEDMPEDASGL